MEEITFFNERGVTITSARFIVPSQTFAMSGITSVKEIEEPPNRIWAVLMILAGLFLLAVAAKDTWEFAVVFFVIVGFIWVVKKSAFHVVLTKASGEAKALTSADGIWIHNVVSALNDSIVHRG